MSLQITKTYANVFDVVVKDNYVRAKLSTSRKDKDGEYINSSWFATFLGNSLGIAKKLKDKDRIIVTNGMVTYEPMMDKNGIMKDDNGKNRYGAKVLVFDMEMNSGTKSKDSEKPKSKSNKKEDNVEEIDNDEDLPF